MPQSWIGKTIGGRYRIEALLGQGGMSAVYRAMDPNLRRAVAIKLIHPHLSEDPNFIGRFKEEAAAVARLRHPNIVQVHDFNQDGEIYYMVMDYLVGETLQARLKRLDATARHMPLPDAIDICAQICDAAGFAHDHELIHRDIKPANIMLDVNSQAILMDFGIVKIIGGEYHTVTGATVGTAKYMSPEQIRSQRVDDRSDIYSLGVTLYEMVSGHPPYQADSALTLMMMVLNDPLPDLRQVRPGVPPGLLAVIYKAMAKERSERFGSMAEMAAVLRQLKESVADIPLEPTLADNPPAGAIIPPPPPSPGTLTFKDEHPEALPVLFPTAGQPEPVLPKDDLAHKNVEEITQPPEDIPTSPKKQEVPAPSALKTKTPSKIKTASLKKPGWPRRLIYAAGAVILLLGIAAIIVFLNSQSPPTPQLTPIAFSPIPINAETAQNVVNLGRWETHSYIVDLAFSPDGTLLATANNRDWVRFTNYRYYAGLWQIETGSIEKYLLGHTQWVAGVAFSPDGQLVSTASDDTNLIIWPVHGDATERIIESSDGGINCVKFSPNNLLLATGSWDGIVSLWEVSSGNLLRTMQESEYGILDVDFSPDGTLLAAASDDNSILVWSVADGILNQTLQGHTAAVRRVTFSPDGMTLASVSEDHSVGLWQLGDSTLIMRLVGHTETVKDVIFSLDGSLLASGSEDGTVRLWRASDGQLLRTLEVEDSVLSLELSPNGFFLAAGAANGMIHFWGFSQALPPQLENTPGSP